MGSFCSAGASPRPTNNVAKLSKFLVGATIGRPFSSRFDAATNGRPYKSFFAFARDRKGFPKGKTFENLQKQIFIGCPLGVVSFANFSLYEQRKVEKLTQVRKVNKTITRVISFYLDKSKEKSYNIIVCKNYSNGGIQWIRTKSKN
ncbi:MAG: hypothetical protein IJ404_03690 [Clostridia bacterium]|nr:hypothetical protein [Clostridia bacterium]